MRLSGITLETEHFEEYLSFLTEVLELELQELTDISMRLDLQSTWLEIKLVPQGANQITTLIEFALDHEEFHDLVSKVSFFYYRRGPSRFLYLGHDERTCQIVDPDGRTWKFADYSPEISNQDLPQASVRNC